MAAAGGCPRAGLLAHQLPVQAYARREQTDEEEPQSASRQRTAGKPRQRATVAAADAARLCKEAELSDTFRLAVAAHGAKVGLLRPAHTEPPSHMSTAEAHEPLTSCKFWCPHSRDRRKCLRARRDGQQRAKIERMQLKTEIDRSRQQRCTRLQTHHTKAAQLTSHHGANGAVERAGRANAFQLRRTDTNHNDRVTRMTSKQV